MKESQNIKKKFCCAFCTSKEATIINTYKHYWVSCDYCGNVIRIKKDKLFFKFISKIFFPKAKVKGFPVKSSFKELIVYALSDEGFSDGTDTYEYYLDFERGFPKTIENTKWESEPIEMIKELKLFDIDILRKTVLEISGGPGFFAKAMQHQTKKWIVTEYNDVVVERMKLYLGLDCIKYDMNNDKISEILNEKFDFIFIRYAINFCNNLDKLIKELSEALNPKGIIYISYYLPTLGNCIRWQLDNYTFNVLYNPETVKRFFAENNFRLIGTNNLESYHFLYSKTHKLHFFASPFHIPAYFYNRFKYTNTNLKVFTQSMFFIKN